MLKLTADICTSLVTILMGQLFVRSFWSCHTKHEMTCRFSQILNFLVKFFVLMIYFLPVFIIHCWSISIFLHPCYFGIKVYQCLLFWEIVKSKIAAGYKMAARFKTAGLMMSYDVITNTYVLSCARDIFIMYPRFICSISQRSNAENLLTQDIRRLTSQSARAYNTIHCFSIY